MLELCDQNISIYVNRETYGELRTGINSKINPINRQNRNRNRCPSFLKSHQIFISPSFVPNLLLIDIGEKHTFSESCTNHPTTSDVQPNNNKQDATISAPPSINGLLRPHLDRDRSAITPMRGWIMRPDNGPAIQTRDVRDFVRPSWRR